MQLLLEPQIFAATKQPLTSEATSAAELAAQRMAMVQGCPLQVHALAAFNEALAQKVSTRQAVTELGPGALNLKLADLLSDAGSSSTTPCTSASSSPKSAPWSPPPGLPASPEMASAAMTPPPGLSAAPSEDEWSPLPHPGLPGSARSGLPPPPGLVLPSFRPPPGLPHPAALPAPAPTAPVVADSSSQQVEWCILHVCSKLKTSAGFALVSPPLQVGGIPDVRLHFAPGEAWAQSMRSRKGKKTGSEVEHGVARGPMNGSLRLKVGDLRCATALKFNLFVGDVRQGPFECNFAERTVQEFQLEVDWRRHVERESGSLRLRLEVLSE